MTSVNNNAAATTALRALQSTNKQLDTVQNRISTGLKIGEAKDNAAYWSIATTLKSDNKSLSTVKDALGLGSATVDVAYQGLNKAKDVLDEIKSKLTAATQSGVDRSKIQSEIAELQKQLVSIGGSSVFSGENWLSVNSDSASYNANKSVVASFSRDASGAVTIGTIGVDISKVALFDASTKADGIVDGRGSMKNADGSNMNIGGFSVGTAPATTALAFAGKASGANASVAAGAVATLGNLDLSAVVAGDKIKFTLNVDGTSNTVSLDTTGLTASNFASNLQAAVNSAVGAGKATVKVGGSNAGTSGAVTIEAAVSTGTGSLVSVGAISTVDGDGIVTDTAGLLTSGALPAPKFGLSFEASASLQDATATTYLLPTAGGAAGSQTLTAVTGDAGSAGTLTFDVAYNGVTRTVTTGSITNSSTPATQAGNVQAAMQAAIDTAFAGTRSVQNGRVYAAGDITISNSSATNTLATNKVGTSETVKISNISGTGGFTPATAAITGINPAGVTATGTGTGAGLIAGDSFSTTVQYGSTVKQISHTFTASDFVSGGIASGWATAGQPTAAEWKTFLQTKVDTAFAGTQYSGSGASYAAGDIVIKQASGVFSIETLKKGADMAVGMSNVQATIYGVASVPTTAGASSRLGMAENAKSNYYNASNVKTAGTGVVGYGKETAPTLALGTFDNSGVKANDRISLTVNVGGSQKTISVATDSLVGTTPGKPQDASVFKSRVQNALDAAFGANVATFDVDSSTYAMTLKSVATGQTSYLAVSNVTTQDGNGANSSAAGLKAGTSNTGVTANGTNVASAATAVLASATAFTGPQTIGANDSVGFSVLVDGTAKGVTIDRARVDAALGTAANGVISNATDYAAVLNSAFTAGGVAVTASAPGNVLTLTRNGGAAAGTVEVQNVASSGGASTMSIKEIDVSDSALAARGVTSANQKDVFSAYISLVNDAISKVTTAAANLGAVSSRIDMQKSFVDTLMDTIDKGVSGLVDADMNEESTKLQALQVKQQLGVQAMSIANQSAQSVLSLFRG